jgi:hypothetical protein
MWQFAWSVQSGSRLLASSGQQDAAGKSLVTRYRGRGAKSGPDPGSGRGSGARSPTGDPRHKHMRMQHVLSQSGTPAHRPSESVVCSFACVCVVCCHSRRLVESDRKFVKIFVSRNVDAQGDGSPVKFSTCPALCDQPGGAVSCRCASCVSNNSPVEWCRIHAGTGPLGHAGRYPGIQDGWWR